MATPPSSVQHELAAHDKLVERIANRYEQLVEELEKLEHRLRDIDISQTTEPGVPQKPR